MSDLRAAAQQAIALICSARLCEVNSMSSRQEMLRLLIEATDLLQAEPAQEPVATVVARQYDDGTYAGNALDWAGRGCENDFPIGTNFYTSPPQPPAPPANQP
jgi:hypothetical protein